MLMYPQINPVALQLGPLAVHWYGLTYLAAFGLFMLLGLRRLQHPAFSQLPPAQAWSRKDVEDILFLGVLGVIVGGRLGYCLFYKPGYYLAHPLEIFAVWTGGMSFHGGLLGVIAAMLWFAHSRQRPWLQVADFVAPCVPTGLAAGRVGNFINGELWGRFAPTCPGAWCFPTAAACWRVTLRRFINFCSKVFCFLYCYGGTPVARVKRVKWLVPSWSATAACALLPSISASLMTSWACSPWA